MNSKTGAIIALIGGFLTVVATFLTRAELVLFDASETVKLLDDGIGKPILAIGLAGVVIAGMTLSGNAGLRVAAISVGGVALALSLVALLGGIADVGEANDLAATIGVEDAASLGIANWIAVLGSAGMLAGGIMLPKKIEAPHEAASDITAVS